MKILILGGGPAGLTLANKISIGGVHDFLLLEGEAQAGGLCRSLDVDGSPLDIGGGHFLDVRNQDVVEFLFSFMPASEWNQYDRKSLIHIHDQYIAHPFEANIWQLSINMQVDYLESIACAGVNSSEKQPFEFVDWIYWKLGKKIAENYMLPYNQKMFGNNLSELGTYWLNKLPSVSFRETLQSCLEHKPYGKLPGHAKFYYPKQFGYGELWNRMANNLGEKIKFNQKVKGIDFNTRSVCTDDGKKYDADLIVSTIPWTSFEKIIGMPSNIVDDIRKLKHTSVKVEYYDKNLDTDAHWIYYPELALSYHRILARHNFVPNGRGYWTETNMDRDEMREKGGVFSYVNEYAYPLNTLQKPKIMDRLLSWSKDHGVIGLGRWGEHSHYNSDVTVERAMALAERINNNEL